MAKEKKEKKDKKEKAPEKALSKISKIKVTDRGETFGFSGDCNTLIDALNKVMEVTGYVTKTDIGRYHVGVASGGLFYIMGYSDETHCVKLVDGFETDGDGSVIFLEPDRLKTLLKNGGRVDFKYDGKLHYKAVKGRFTGNVICNSVSAEQLPRIRSIVKSSKAGTDLIDSSLLAAIREGVKRTNLIDPHMQKSLLCFLNFSKGHLIVSNFDTLHLAHYDIKVDTTNTTPFRLAFPANMFQVVDRFLEGDDDANFQMSGNSFTVSSNTFVVGFPPSQTDDVNFERTKNFIAALSTPVCSFTLDSTLKDAQASLKSLTAQNEYYTMEINSKVKLSVATDFGQGSDTFKVNDLKKKSKEKLIVKMDPKILDDLIPLLASNSFPFKLYTRSGKIFMYTMKTTTGAGASLTLMGSIPQ